MLQLSRKSFGQNKFSAYEAFRNCSWSPGETVDSFMSELRRLANLAGIESDELIRCAFICGLPPDVSAQLRASARIEELELHTILETARVLMDERIQGAFVSVYKPNSQFSTKRGQMLMDERNQGALVPAQESNSQSSSERRGQRISCFKCGGNHSARFC